MNAKMLRAILENIEDDIDIFVTVDGHDVEVGCMHLNEQEGYIALEPWDAWDDGDADDEGDETDVRPPLEGDPACETGTSCDIPEYARPGLKGIKDL
jgi:hypothetical protein